MMTTSQNPFFSSVGATYRGYRVSKIVPVDEIRCTLRELIHEPTGATVLHLENDDPENLFCLSFRTYPSSSNGVAHILEHTVLCGSKKFPVKDPFFCMMRRSLHTFMNALTGSDFTCYPASTQVPQDFYNLLDVYLDAVFYPNLEELSFRQEGHRLEFTDPLDASTPLQYKGIVYNEMKGAMASANARLYNRIGQELFPDLTYGYNSGGDPKAIPDLSYDEFRAFHRDYYHPSRCLFYFYGNLPLKRHLDFLADNVLEDTQAVPDLPKLPKQKRFTQPVVAEDVYPIGPDESSEKRAYISFAWLTCDLLEQEELLALNVLDSVLMDTDASPLRYALLQSGLCTQVGSSIDDEVSEVPYVLTARGCEAESADQFEKVLRETLNRLADEGISPQLIDSAIHQLEFQRSETTGDGAPFGLDLFWRSALLRQHQGNSESGLIIHTLFAQLRGRLEKDPNYLSKLIRKHLLENPHRVRVVLRPDKELTAREFQEEQEVLSRLQESLTPEAAQQIVQQAEALYAFQKDQDNQDLTCLPRLGMADIPSETQDYPLESETIGKLKVFRHSCFTNGILYANLSYNLPFLAEDELSLVRLFTSLAAQLGCGGRDYRENLRYLHQHTGGVGLSLSTNLQATDSGSMLPTLQIRGKSLYRKVDRLFPVLKDLVQSIDLTDRERIVELLQKQQTALEASFTSHAMRYALKQSACGLDVPSRVQEAWTGLEYYRTIRQLVQDLGTQLPRLLDKMEELKERVLGLAEPHLVLACDETFYEAIREQRFFGLEDLPVRVAAPWRSEYALPACASYSHTVASPVAFTGKTLRVVGYLHQDAPALSLVGSLLENKILHQRVREKGGAYGVGAGNNPMAGHFSFYAYRDPRISTTLQAFEDAVQHIADGHFTEEDLVEAKLEVIQGADSPVAPGSRASLAYSWLRSGKTLERRQAFRDRLLAATREEVAHAVRTHLVPQLREAPTVVFAGKELLDKENQKLEEEGHQPLPIHIL